jgi:hypothetical protein
MAGAVGALAGPAVYRLLESRVGVPVLLRAGLVIETTTHLILALTCSGGRRHDDDLWRARRGVGDRGREI